jgi:hypothetical protein
MSEVLLDKESPKVDCPFKIMQVHTYSQTFKLLLRIVTSQVIHHLTVNLHITWSHGGLANYMYFSNLFNPDILHKMLFKASVDTICLLK